MSERLEQIIYYSLWRPQTDVQIAKAVEDILVVASARNRHVNVTGALVACNGWFLQVIEGAPDQVRAIYATIQKDRRHHMVALIGTRPTFERAFPLWGMCGANLHPKDDALISVLGRQRAFSPPDLSFDLALEVLKIVQLVQARAV
jgi:hypothetical protein